MPIYVKINLILILITILDIFFMKVYYALDIRRASTKATFGIQPDKMTSKLVLLMVFLMFASIIFSIITVFLAIIGA